VKNSKKGLGFFVMGGGTTRQLLRTSSCIFLPKKVDAVIAAALDFPIEDIANSFSQQY
jgi:hypothetical protein